MLIMIMVVMLVVSIRQADQVSMATMERDQAAHLEDGV